MRSTCSLMEADALKDSPLDELLDISPVLCGPKAVVGSLVGQPTVCCVVGGRSDMQRVRSTHWAGLRELLINVRNDSSPKLSSKRLNKAFAPSFALVRFELVPAKSIRIVMPFSESDPPIIKFW